MSQANLFTVTTKNFSKYQILSSLTKDELENEYYEVVDNGMVSEIEEDEENEKVYFTHQRSRKSLPFDCYLLDF
jgi:hypothetical protein